MCLSIAHTRKISLSFYYTECSGNVGAVKYLRQRHDLTKWQMRGASAGALVACLAACNVDPEKAYEAAHRSVISLGCYIHMSTYLRGRQSLILFGMPQDI